MSSDKTIILDDRSGASLDDKCGMAFYANRFEAGRGIVSKVENFHFRIGRESHEDLATIAGWTDLRPEAIEEHIKTILDQLTPDDKLIEDKMEELYRRLGWIAAFALYVEPKWRAEWDTIQVEHELILDRSPLWVPFTPDRVLQHKDSKAIVYKEFKSCKEAGYRWQQSWPFAVQLHIALAGLEEEMKIKPNYGQIVGLMKGREGSAGHLVHPYVWAYYSPIKDEWTHDYNRARGSEWRPEPVWNYPDGLVKWVQRLGEDIGMAQFPHSAPVFLNPKLLDEWVIRRKSRRLRLKASEGLSRQKPEFRAIMFEKRTDQCRPAFGEQCPYLMYCWNAEVNRDPLGSGHYVPRVPHHEVEILMNREEDSK